MSDHLGASVSQIEVLQDKIDQARNELKKVIIGQEEIVDSLFLVLLTKGHALLIGVPGLAKTLMVYSLAKVFDGDFNRVQFTPDLMPSDITGVDLIQENPNNGKKEFKFIKGPIFCNILLADEINRTPPKTQSALLQAMQEHSVSQGDKTYDIESPFFVLATQNPIEQEGTYPLPEAQLDRFTFSLKLKYPSFEDEVKIATLEDSFDQHLTPKMTLSELVDAQKVVEAIPIGQELVEYAVRINFATRKDTKYATPLVKKYITWGAGPRASQSIVHAAKAKAFMEGRLSVSASDIAYVSHLVLDHRLVMNFQGEAEGITISQVIDEIVESVK